MVDGQLKPTVEIILIDVNSTFVAHREVVENKGCVWTSAK